MGCGNAGKHGEYPREPTQFFIPSKLKIIDGIPYYTLSRTETKLLPKVHKRFERILQTGAVPSVSDHKREKALAVDSSMDKSKNIINVAPSQRPTKERVHNPSSILKPPQNTVTSKGVLQDTKMVDSTRDIDPVKYNEGGILAKENNYVKNNELVEVT